MVVPMTIDAAIERQLGEPKFLFPDSENAWPFSFLSLVHLTTSQGGDGLSVSDGSSISWLLRDTVLLCPPRNAGDDGREERRLGEDILDWNRRSNALKEGVGLLSPGREATEGSTLLLGDERTEP